MKSKGFTLIELLAVIVILAIIALIATPIILNIIEDAKEESVQRSAENYIEAVGLAIAKENMEREFNPSTCKIISNGNLECEDYEGTIKVEVDGEVPETEGSVLTFTNGEVTGGSFKISGTNFVIEEGTLKKGTQSITVTKACTLEDKDENAKYSIGDVVSCELENSIENFYVIENESEDTTEGIDMLAMYNLNVGDYKYPNESTYGIQDANAIGGMDANYENTNYGGIESFSSNYYWVNQIGSWEFEFKNGYGESEPAFIYDSNSNLYNYVDSYKTYLATKIDVINATLLSFNQAQTLGCVVEGVENFVMASSCSSDYPWVYSTNYWLGSVGMQPEYNVDLWYITTDNGILCGGATSPGVRPVITIKLDQIKL